MSHFFESIKVEDQSPFLLDFHQKRLDSTLAHFGAENVKIDLKSIYNALEHDENGLYKWRLTYSISGDYKSQVLPYAISEIENFKLMKSDDISYPFKSEDRQSLEKLKKKSGAQEIIIVKNNDITDTSFSNLLFLKKKEWFTPNSYLLNGVQRQHLLATKRVKETFITLENVEEFSHFQIINAMNDFDDMFIYPIERILNLPKDEEDTDL